MGKPAQGPPFAATRRAPRRDARRDRRATARIGRGPADALRQAQLCLQGRPADPARALHPVDSHPPGQDRHQVPHRRAARPLPTMVRQQPTAQRPRRQARDRVPTSDPDRRSVDGQDRYPGLDTRPETPENRDIALARPRIPAHQPTIGALASPLEHQPPVHGRRSATPQAPSRGAAPT